MKNTDINNVQNINSNSQTGSNPADRHNGGNTSNANGAHNNGQNGKTKKPSSARRIASSQANGAESKGPVTPEGKAASSQNARKHGLLARAVTLSPHDEEVYTQLYELYAQRFEPRDQVEHDLLEEAVFYKFQMRHAWMQQTSALDLQIALDRKIVDSEWADATDNERRVIALTNSIKDGSTIPLLQRYARSLATQAERTIKLLLELRKQRLPPVGELPPPNVQPEKRNDPNPDSGHPQAAHEVAPETEPLAPAAAATAAICAWSTPRPTAQPVHIAPVRSETAVQQPETAATPKLLAMAA